MQNIYQGFNNNVLKPLIVSLEELSKKIMDSATIEQMDIKMIGYVNTLVKEIREARLNDSQGMVLHLSQPKQEKPDFRSNLCKADDIVNILNRSNMTKMNYIETQGFYVPDAVDVDLNDADIADEFESDLFIDADLVTTRDDIVMYPVNKKEVENTYTYTNKYNISNSRGGVQKPYIPERRLDHQIPEPHHSSSTIHTGYTPWYIH